MKVHLLAVLLCLAPIALALEGDVQSHDPSTIAVCNGKYYVYSTGAGLPVLVSEDGWTWRRAGVAMEGLPGGKPGPQVIEKSGGDGSNNWAPDIIQVGDRYFMYYSAPSTQPRSAIGLMTATTLDPESPDSGWTDGGPVVWSDGTEDCNAIDPGVFLDPTTGRLWLTYGSYFGYIRLVELDPATGQRLHPDEPPVNIAVNCEASIIIHRDGWYYLLATHGSCCSGTNSTYNIRVGRSRQVGGPYLDHEGINMLRGGGKLFLGSSARAVGPGHFGLLDLGDGVQKFSTHYEADLDRGGISVLDIRPLLWEDGWPVAGENFAGGTFQIQSARSGNALELAVEGVPVGGLMRSPRDPGPRPPIPDQDVTETAPDWPDGNVDVRMGPYMLQAQQKWTITPVPEAGGYEGAPYFKILIHGTDRALAASEEGELIAVPAFSGAPEQLWRIDQLTDGTYRIMPRRAGTSRQPLALSAIGASSVTLSPFDPDSPKMRWMFMTP